MPRRPRKYRLWTTEEKRSICQQTTAPGVSVAQVARRYSMNANLIFKWLKDPRYTPDTSVADATVFLPVEIASSSSEDADPCAGALCRGGLGRVEVVLSGGTHLTIEDGSDAAELVRLIKGLIE